MHEDELKQAIEGLASSDRLRQADAVYDLALSADPRAFDVLMALAKDRDRWLPLEHDAFEGFLKGIPATIPFLIPRYVAAPKSREGEPCGDALGEIAYRTRFARSSRIDEALFTVLRRVVELGTHSADGTVHSLRQCAYARPVREATPWLWLLLERSRAEMKPAWCLRDAMDALVAAEGESVLPRLIELKAAVHPEHQLACEFEMFLENRLEASAYELWRYAQEGRMRALAGAQDEEIQRLIEGLESVEPVGQTRAFYDLAHSGNARAFDFLMGALGEPVRWFGKEPDVVRGLVDGAPATIALVASHYLASPTGRERTLCEYVLGEIAYRSKAMRDPRIDAALLAGLEQTIDQGTDATSRTVEALRECARAKPVEGAAPLLWRVLERSCAEAHPNPWCLRMALLALQEAEGNALPPRLSQLRSGMAPDHPLGALIEEFFPR